MSDVHCFVNGRLVVEHGSTEQLPCAEPQAPSLTELVAAHPFLVISVENCPQCEELAALLGGRGMSPEVTVKWDKGASEYPALKQALATHAGDVFTFPQVFAEGSYQGGLEEVAKKTHDGCYDELFERLFSAEPSTLRRRVEEQSMVVFSLPNCPQCDVLYADLQRRGVPVRDVFVKLDKAQPQYPSFKAQLQRLTGKQSFTFPQTFLQGVYQGDYDEVICKADQGDFASTFESSFGIQPPMQDKITEAPAMGAIAFDEDF